MASDPFIKVANDFESVCRQQPFRVSGDCLTVWWPFDVVDVEWEVVSLTPHSECTHLHPVGCLVVFGNEAHYCCVICKLDDWVGGVHGHAVMGEQGVQEGAEHAPLWGPRCCFLPSPPGGRPVRKSRTQLHREGLRPRASSLMMSFEGTMVLNAEL